MEEIITNIHIHTLYSDGKKTHRAIADDAAKAGLDAIIVTDHNIHPQGFDGYYQAGDRNILLIIGEEVHDRTRVPQKNHMLVVGAEKSLASIASKPQKLIDAANKVGGLTFLAHPFDPELKIVNEADLSWEDWSVSGYTGLEIWNNLSEFKIRVKSKFDALKFALIPGLMAKGPPLHVRQKWDALTKSGNHVVAIGGSDAHTLTKRLLGFKKMVFPYYYHFKTINTHLLLEKKLTGDPESDRKSVLDSLRMGRAFIGHDGITPTKGFRFKASSKDQDWVMGDSVRLTSDLLLTITLPGNAEILLIKDSEIIERKRNAEGLTYQPKAPGVYRVECYRNSRMARRGWIFSNPIYIQPA